MKAPLKTGITARRDRRPGYKPTAADKAAIAAAKLKRKSGRCSNAVNFGDIPVYVPTSERVRNRRANVIKKKKEHRRLVSARGGAKRWKAAKQVRAESR